MLDASCADFCTDRAPLVPRFGLDLCDCCGSLVVDVHFINFQANFNLRTLRASLLTSGLNVTDQQLFFVDLLWEMMVEPGTGEPLRQASPDGKVRRTQPGNSATARAREFGFLPRCLRVSCSAFRRRERCD